MSKLSEYQVTITPECHTKPKAKSDIFEVSKRMHNDGFVTVQLVPSCISSIDIKEDQIIKLKPKSTGIKGFFDIFSK